MMALMTLMNPLGTMVGFVLPYAFIDSSSTNDTIKEQFLRFMIFQVGFTGVILILAVLLLRPAG